MSDSEEEFLLLCYVRNSQIASQIKLRMGLSNVEQNENETKEKENTENEGKRKRRWQSDRIVESNRIYGEYGLVKELISEEDKIMKNLNMSAVDFYELLDLIRDDIIRENTAFRRPIPPEARLSVTLRFLITGENHLKLGNTYCLGASTISQIIRETCTAIFSRLQPLVIPQLSMEKLCESAAKMGEVTKFPNCVGVLDGKCLFDRKYFFKKPHLHKGVFDKSTAVLFALVDANYCFLAIHMLPKSQPGIQAFMSTLLGSMIPEENMPPPSLLHETGNFLPYVVLGNECVPLSKYLMSPYTMDDLFKDPSKGIYNKMHCQALEVAGYAFGLLAQRYKFFQVLNVMNYSTLETITKASCCLHNFMQLKDIQRNNTKIDEIAIRQASENAFFQPLMPYVGPISAIGKDVRENFLAYFSSQSNVSVTK